jgi:hypothetical protein
LFGPDGAAGQVGSPDQAGPWAELGHRDTGGGTVAAAGERLAERLPSGLE